MCGSSPVTTDSLVLLFGHGFRPCSCHLESPALLRVPGLDQHYQETDGSQEKWMGLAADPAALHGQD